MFGSKSPKIDKTEFIAVLSDAILDYRKNFATWAPPLRRAENVENELYRLLTQGAQVGITPSEHSVHDVARFAIEAAGYQQLVDHDGKGAGVFVLRFGRGTQADWQPSPTLLSDERDRTPRHAWTRDQYRNDLRRAVECEQALWYALAWARTDPHNLGEYLVVAFIMRHEDKPKPPEPEPTTRYSYLSPSPPKQPEPPAAPATPPRNPDQPAGPPKPSAPAISAAASTAERLAAALSAHRAGAGKKPLAASHGLCALAGEIGGIMLAARSAGEDVTANEMFNRLLSLGRYSVPGRTRIAYCGYAGDGSSPDAVVQALAANASTRAAVEGDFGAVGVYEGDGGMILLFSDVP